jgi:ABC-type phosphate transport system auxiliary subunit
MKETDNECNSYETAANSRPNEIPAEDGPAKNSNPLSVRVDPDYRERFESLTKELGISKKSLFENLIQTYLQKDEQNRRETDLNLSNEINLISANLDDLLKIFTKMAVKSQDTIGSLKSDSNQQISNLETQLNTLKQQTAVLNENNQLLEAANHGYNCHNGELEQTITDLKAKISNLKNEINQENLKNLELLEQLNQSRHVESENLLLKNEAAKVALEVKTLQSHLDEAHAEVIQLRKKVTNLEKGQHDWKERQIDAWREREAQLRREAQLDRKTALLELQAEYNNLQAENLRCLGEINQKAAELTELKLQLREKNMD